jgi:hypothetical protein
MAVIRSMIRGGQDLGVAQERATLAKRMHWFKLFASYTKSPKMHRCERDMRPTQSCNQMIMIKLSGGSDYRMRCKSPNMLDRFGSHLHGDDASTEDVYALRAIFFVSVFILAPLSAFYRD